VLEPLELDLRGHALVDVLSQLADVLFQLTDVLFELSDVHCDGRERSFEAIQALVKAARFDRRRGFTGEHRAAPDLQAPTVGFRLRRGIPLGRFLHSQAHPFPVALDVRDEPVDFLSELHGTTTMPSSAAEVKGSAAGGIETSGRRGHMVREICGIV
jgi:hypothetical protein